MIIQRFTHPYPSEEGMSQDPFLVRLLAQLNYFNRTTISFRTLLKSQINPH